MLNGTVIEVSSNSWRGRPCERQHQPNHIMSNITNCPLFVLRVTILFKANGLREKTSIKYDDHKEASYQRLIAESNM